METPSFRIIDFGRGRNMAERGENGNTQKDAADEEQRMKDLLGIDGYDA